MWKDLGGSWKHPYCRSEDEQIWIPGQRGMNAVSGNEVVKADNGSCSRQKHDGKPSGLEATARANNFRPLQRLQ
jgi:hypothetical protein